MIIGKGITIGKGVTFSIPPSSANVGGIFDAVSNTKFTLPAGVSQSSSVVKYGTTLALIQSL